MSQYQVGEWIQKRCRKCFHNESQIIKVDEKDLNKRTGTILWCQCPECGLNDHELTPEEV
ncbi:hypothetical protein SAMN05192559_11290 [Halobacillus karajensis]|uniref:hypothetical protein n=1 Tax=Halobacillus karajensis TaxID=195088 RepID=UPI0008A72E80|nr:hypothetical protein [Halobacillus karajensis]SEI10685.1 hypothetical protein SAMN05192559_11290 [Halobacillus karajensis]